MNSFATVHTPVSGSTMSMPSPLKSMNIFSPARWVWRIETVTVSAKRAYLSQNWLYWRPSGCSDLYSSQSSALVTCFLRSSRWMRAQSGSGLLAAGRPGLANRSPSSAASSPSSGGSGQVSPAALARHT